jgi:predicted RNase H-like HicB family nuclease
MTQSLRLTAIIEREEEGFVSQCPEFDIASQGSSVEEAGANLVEALSLFFETWNGTDSSWSANAGAIGLYYAKADRKLDGHRSRPPS